MACQLLALECSLSENRDRGLVSFVPLNLQYLARGKCTVSSYFGDEAAMAQRP